MNRIKPLLLVIAALTLAACASKPSAKKEAVEPDLEGVIAAVHVAMRDLANAADLVTINGTYTKDAAQCAIARKQAKNDCAAMRATATQVACQCAPGTPAPCMPSQPALCSAYLGHSQAQCADRVAAAAASEACATAKERGNFVFKQADVSLSVTRSKESSGGFKLFIFGVSGKKGAENAQSIDMTLKPFAAQNAAAEANLPRQLVEALVSQVSDALKVAVQKKFKVPPSDTDVPAQAAISDLSVSVGLTVQRVTSGDVEWELAPIGVNASHEVSRAGVSKVTFVYGIEE